MEETSKERPGLAKRILKRIVLVVLLIILFFALIGLWAWKEQSDYESTAVPYLESVIPEIVTWNPDVIWDYYDDEVRSVVSQEDSAKVIRYLSQLGTLDSLSRPQFRQVTSSATLKTGTKKLVVYQVPAVFENGDATIGVTLVDRDGEFSIYHFKVNSMAFLEASEETTSDISSQEDTSE